MIWVVGQLLHFDDYLLRFFRHETIHMKFIQEILGKIGRLDWQRIEQPDTEKIIRSVIDNGSWSTHQYVDSISYCLTVVVSFVFAISTIQLSWILILALLIGAIPTGVQTLLYTHVDSRLYDVLIPRYIKLGGIMDFFHSFNIIFESKVNRAEEYLRQVEADERRGNLNLYYSRFSKLFWTNLITITTSVGSNIFVLWYLIGKVVDQTLPIGTFQYYLTTFNKLRLDIESIFSSVGQMEDGYRYLRYFYALMHLQPALADGKQVISTTTPPRIEYQQVSFAYPDSTAKALKNISVTIEPGEKIALVGENGAGKSTFVRLLLRAYDPSTGVIMINDHPLPKLTKASWYDQVTLIPQDFARYDVLSVAENIGLGDKDNIEQVKNAAQLSEAADFISKLPAKYQTILSRKLDKGVELSSGQWQKIGLARLFYAHRNIVILDEPTASIDPVSEYQIFKNVYQKLMGKTVILVSHRYSTVKEADKILVFKDGQIIEQGTFNQLIKAKGYFAHAYALQQETKHLKPVT